MRRMRGKQKQKKTTTKEFTCCNMAGIVTPNSGCDFLGHQKLLQKIIIK
jgi:hypothetical protein